MLRGTKWQYCLFGGAQLFQNTIRNINPINVIWFICLHCWPFTWATQTCLVSRETVFWKVGRFQCIYSDWYVPKYLVFNCILKHFIAHESRNLFYKISCLNNNNNATDSSVISLHHDLTNCKVDLDQWYFRINKVSEIRTAGQKILS